MMGDTERLIKMAQSENVLCVAEFNDYTLFNFVDEYCFKEWKYRSRYLNVEDFLYALDYMVLVEDAKFNIEAHLTLIELIYNFWNLANNKFEDKFFKGILKWCGNFYHLKDVMDEILEEYNHTVYANEENDYFIVVENKPGVTAAAEIMPTPALSFDVIRYNHRSLKGDIQSKKAILIALGADLEAKRRDLQSINKKLSDDIFFMLNNVNIRHNNCSKQDSTKYKEYVATMPPEQLEVWYDELYQMILLGFLLLDNKERSIKIGELKDNINRGANYGQTENADAEQG